MDDRFDRRELLLHLGDVLEAASGVAKIDRPDVPVSRLALSDSSLQAFPFLRNVATRVLAKDFSQRVASAYGHWPRALLEAELDHAALALPVRRELFDGGADGWDAYVGYMRQKVIWFGVELPDNATSDTKTAGPSTAAPVQERSPLEKTGWPWTPLG
ncbi:hypothetical protein C9I57_21840 [Trinickia symbiotica]|uniref:Uncharacterized protein n=1 Tax=Trinickia symbiotica TaxID=863227 RepID=A0A2T3XQ63_9BURK|nr:hypothetical protein [Trinickia symbiotica]PTB18653.1 hypothetical protein C9I57_21840 [Trinickia symbiotica]